MSTHSSLTALAKVVFSFSLALACAWLVSATVHAQQLVSTSRLAAELSDELVATAESSTTRDGDVEARDKFRSLALEAAVTLDVLELALRADPDSAAARSAYADALITLRRLFAAGSDVNVSVSDAQLQAWMTKLEALEPVLRDGPLP